MRKCRTFDVISGTIGDDIDFAGEWLGLAGLVDSSSCITGIKGVSSFTTSCSTAISGSCVSRAAAVGGVRCPEKRALRSNDVGIDHRNSSTAMKAAYPDQGFTNVPLVELYSTRRDFGDNIARESDSDGFMLEGGVSLS